MHDGQMLFDRDTTWNKQSWNVDQTAARLAREGRIPDTIVVGIWNRSDYRYAKYYPQKYLAYADQATRKHYVQAAQRGKSLSDDYLRFIVEELKPAIDRRYATRPGPASTFMMGSSMGGMISLYALFEYPQVFGGAAGLSTTGSAIRPHGVWTKRATAGCLWRAWIICKRICRPRAT